MTPFIVSLLVKVTLVLALGLIVTASLRSFGPSFRHQILLVTLASCLSLPALILLAPRWDVPVLPSSVGIGATTGRTSPVISTSEARGSSSNSGADVIAPSQDVQRSPIQSGLGNPTGIAMLAIVWVAGFMAVLIWLAAGRIRLRRIASASWPLNDADWDRVLREESREAGVSKSIRLLSSSVVSTPLTWGWRAPIILVPEDALDWSEAHRRVVLRHELAHVARGDAFSQLVAGFVCAMYWFHPNGVGCRAASALRMRACLRRSRRVPRHSCRRTTPRISWRWPGPRATSARAGIPVCRDGAALAAGRAVARGLERIRTACNAIPGMRAAALLVSVALLITVSAFRAIPRTLSPSEAASSVAQTSRAMEANAGATLPVSVTDPVVSTKACCRRASISPVRFHVPALGASAEWRHSHH